VTPEQQKEELSRAWVTAIAAACGYAVGHWSQDQDCVDLTIGAPGVLGAGTLADPKLDLQLKATNSPNLIHENRVSIQLDRAQYSQLTRKSSVPKVLVVLVLPADQSLWVTATQESLVLKKSAYYLPARLFEPIGETAASKLVNVPYTNPFTPGALRAMMERVSREEAP
jgi:Domain of unknown function (DUF4365)